MLHPGDEINIETHCIRVLTPPSGFTVALEVNVDQERQNRGLESTYTTNIESASWGLRGPSYIFATLILCFGLVWPIVSHYNKTIDHAGDAPEENGGFHGDKYWSTGPLIQAHRMALGDNCSACHQSAFKQVTDEACESCHSVQEHVGNHFSNELSDEIGACQKCHKEHNEPQNIIVNADSLCTDCHRDSLSSSGAESKTEGKEKIPTRGNENHKEVRSLRSVTGFSPDSHPRFKLSFFIPQSNEAENKEIFEWVPITREPSSEVKEKSNLKFDHQVHLNSEKMRMTQYPDGMDCANCHELLADNEHFAPIDMESHCASCHQLKFDTDNLDRELPHGKPKEVLLMLEEHYVRKFTDPSFNAAPRDRRRRLGVKSDSCSKGFECGIAKAEKEAQAQFTQGVCNYCHTVVENESDDLFDRWFVLPVNINSDWYPGAHFNHVSHLTQYDDETEACLSCHKANMSEYSHDILIPGIDNCTECHGDVSDKDKVSLPCISCHVYHPKPFL